MYSMAVLYFWKPETIICIILIVLFQLILLIDKIINIPFKIEKRTETLGI